MTIGIDPLFTVHRNGEYMGIIDEEQYVMDVLPSPEFYDDDCIIISKLNINRFCTEGLTVKDKFTEESNPLSAVLCYNKEEAEKLCRRLNELNLQKERLEAEIRADNL